MGVRVMRELSKHGDLEKERERLIVHLESAFRSASRAGGVSWSEAGVVRLLKEAGIKIQGL